MSHATTCSSPRHPIALVLLASLLGSSLRAEVVNVVLVAGQSNASGRATTAELPASPIDDTIDFYFDTDITGASTRLDSGGQFVPLAPPGSTFGPEMALGRVLHQKGVDNLALIKVTRGGTNLRRDWEKGNTNGDEMYPLFTQTVSAALNAIAQRGDTANVLGMVWHQGEGDATFESNNPGSYQANLTQLIDNVRTDLSLPGLPVIVGGVLEAGREPLYAAQQATAAAVEGVSFVSSTETVAFDVTTHFDGKSQLWMGTRFANALTPSDEYIEFEQPGFDVGPLTSETGWVSAGAPEDRVVSTLSSGSYVAGQALGHVDAGGTTYLGTQTLIPTYSRSMSASFFAGDRTDHDQDGSPDYDDQGDADSSVHLFGWAEDLNEDGAFSGSSNDQRGVGFGLDNDGTFILRTAEGIELSTGAAYSVDTWYQITLTWSDPNEDGDRRVKLFAEDLSSESHLNGGEPLFDSLLSAEQFGIDPSEWIGTGVRATRGLIDNLHHATDTEILDGDFNGDGKVDAADYSTWRDAMLDGGELASDYTRGVGPDDYHRWSAAYGTSLSSPSSKLTIPEPATLSATVLVVSQALASSLPRRAALKSTNQSNKVPNRVSGSW